MRKKNKEKRSQKPEGKKRYTSRIGMVGLGIKIKAMKILEPIVEKVKIKQKTVKDKPVEKLLDALICILMGVKGLVEINTRLRSEEAIYRAFGRKRCGEQSVVQQTLDASTGENVKEMEEAVKVIFKKHSQAAKHEVKKNGKLVLDIDLTGRPCGKKAECATKGYFSGERNRSGRQVGRVIATQYEEIVVDQLFEGKKQLYAGVESLMEAAEKVLGLEAADRAKVIVRLDAGGGTVESVNWLLKRGYEVITKDFSGNRAQRLAATVTQWHDDPQHEGRQIGEVTQPADYVREVRRIAVRCPRRNGDWAVGILITTLTPADVMRLARHPIDGKGDEKRLLLATVVAYDQRGGGVELSFKQDKQGLHINQRNKKRFAAQQMVMLLEQLAHNLWIWARRWLSSATPSLAKLGLLRFVRDVLQTNGQAILTDKTTISGLILNKAAPWAETLATALASLLRSEHLSISIQRI